MKVTIRHVLLLLCFFIVLLAISSTSSVLAQESEDPLEVVAPKLELPEVNAVPPLVEQAHIVIEEEIKEMDLQN